MNLPIDNTPLLWPGVLSTGLLLISVNPSDNQVRMWSCRDLSELSIQDLVGIIGRNYRATSVEDEDCLDGISF